MTHPGRASSSSLSESRRGAANGTHAPMMQQRIHQ